MTDPAALLDYFWHLVLPMIAMALSAFATTTMLTKNSFLDEIRKQYVMTARAKGLTERKVLYGHVFRNAMLIVIAGFPGAFIGAFFAGSLLIETIFSLDGLGLLGFEFGAEPRLPGGLRHPLHLLADGTGRQPDLGPHLYLDRSADRFRDARGLSQWIRSSRSAGSTRSRPVPGQTQPPPRRFALSPINRRRLDNFKANRRGYYSLLDIPRRFSACRFSPSSSSTIGRS